MGAMTFTLTEEMTCVNVGSKKMTCGLLTFSSSYAAGGDSFDPADIGLAVVEYMQFGIARNTSAGVIPVLMNTVAVITNKFAGGSPIGLIGAFVEDPALTANVGTGTALIQVDNGTPLNAYVGWFMAIGV